MQDTVALLLIGEIEYNKFRCSPFANARRTIIFCHHRSSCVCDGANEVTEMDELRWIRHVGERESEEENALLDTAKC